MIVRWRIEVEAPTREDAEQQMDEATLHFLEYLRVTDSSVEYECTDEFIGPMWDDEGIAMTHCRRVFKVMEDIDG